jgi:hypothetical protein
MDPWRVAVDCAAADRGKVITSARRSGTHDRKTCVADCLIIHLS